MHPILLRLGPFTLLGHTLGPLTLHTYGLLVAVGFLVGLWWVVRAARLARLPAEPLLDVAFAAVVGGIVGARLLYVLFNLGEYAAEPLRVLKLWEGGLVFHGGLLLAIPSCILVARRARLPLWEVADVFAPAIALGQAIGRLGCFAAGCCYGAPWDPPFCVTYTHPEALAPLGVGLFPSQLLAALSGFLVFAALAIYGPRRRAAGQVFWLFLALGSAARLVEDAFRAPTAKLPLIPGFSATQAIALGLGLAGLVLFVRFGRGARRLPLP